MSGAKVCPHPGCPNLRPCPTHSSASAQRADTNRPSPAARGYGARWQRKSRMYRADHPTCERAGCPRPSECVDHLDGLGPTGPRGYDDNNLEALCWSCHSRKTATFDRGFGNTPKARADG